MSITGSLQFEDSNTDDCWGMHTISTITTVGTVNTHDKHIIELFLLLQRYESTF